MEIIEQTENVEELEVEKEAFEVENDWKYLELFNSIQGNFLLTDIMEKYSKIVTGLIEQAELSLSGTIWKKEYEKNEKLFSTEILYPLLPKWTF